MEKVREWLRGVDLNDAQCELLTSEDKFIYLSGEPRTGKSFAVTAKVAQVLLDGGTVVILDEGKITRTGILADLESIGIRIPHRLQRLKVQENGSKLYITNSFLQGLSIDLLVTTRFDSETEMYLARSKQVLVDNWRSSSMKVINF